MIENSDKFKDLVKSFSLGRPTKSLTYNLAKRFINEAVCVRVCVLKWDAVCLLMKLL